MVNLRSAGASWAPAALTAVLIIAQLLLPGALLGGPGVSPGAPGSGSGGASSREPGEPPLPDLVLSNLSWSLSSPDDGAAVTFFATVFNDGASLTEPARVELYVDGSPSSSAILSGLAGGSLSTVGLPWTAVSGPHELAAVADSAAAVPELNETNNLRTAYLTVPFPDLVIQNVSWYPQRFTDGDDVVINVEVRNLGPGSAGRSSTLGALMDLTQLPRQLLGPVPSGGSALATVRWTASSGEHALLLEADCAGQIREGNESNNRLLVHLGADHPDLTVASVSLQPPSPSEGELAVINATVRNLGPGNTTDSFYVQMIVDGAPAGAVRVHGLAAGASRSVSVQWRAASGHHELRAVVDSGGEVAESIESNNAGTSSAEVAPADLYLMGLLWDPALPCDGATTRVNVTVVNGASSATLSPFVVALYADGAQADAVPLNGLGALEARNLTLEWVASAGPHQLRVSADPHDAVHELDESNNTLLARIVVPLPDLTVTNLSLSPPRPGAGDSAAVRATVGNYGPGNLSRPALLRVLADGREVGSVQVEGLSTSLPRTVEVSWTAEPGVRELTAVVDPLEAVAEASELNNALSLAVEVPYPDLVVAGVNWSPPAAGAGERLNVTVRVENRGSGNLSAPFALHLLLNGSPAGQLSLPGLGAGGNLSANFSLVLPSSVAMIECAIDPQNRVRELSEANNALAMDYPTGAPRPSPDPPDYYVKEIRQLPESPADGEVASVLVTVGDGRGPTAPPSRVDVSLVVDGRPSDRAQALVSAGEGVARLEWEASPGAHRLLVVVDPDGELPEAREDNNQDSIQAFVGAANIALASLSPARPSAADGEMVNVLCALENKSPHSTRRELSVELYVDGLLVEARRVSGLPAASTNTQLFSFTASPGTHELRAVADADAAVAESDEGDNEALSSMSAGSPDIEVAAVDTIDVADEGNTVRITSTLYNRGASTVRDISVLFLVDGAPAGSARCAGLASGATVLVSTQWTASPGRHRVVAVADPGRAVSELEEGNNWLAVWGANVSLPDIAVRGLRVLGPPVEGADGLVAAELANEGSTTLRDFYVVFSIDGVAASTQRVGGLPGGASCTVSAAVPTRAGPRLYAVWADSTSAVQELDETNNRAQTLHEATGAVELSLVGLKVQQEAVDGEEVGIFAEVANTGAGNTTLPFQVAFYVDGMRASSETIRGIPAGETAVASARWVASPGKHTVRAVVDAAWAVPEGDETDNEARRSGPIVEPPDLTIDSISSAWADEAGGSVAVHASLENAGGPTMRTVTVQLLIDGRAAAHATASGLPARATTEVYLEASAPSPGLLSVRADPAGSVVEADESNNEASAVFSPVPDPPDSSPDLTVSGWTLLPPRPIESQPSLLLATVTNLGNGSLRGRAEALLRLQSMAPDPANPKREVVTAVEELHATIYGLLPGGSAVVSFPWTARGGPTNLTVTVDHPSMVAESDETNNVLKDQTDVLRPDLFVTGVVRWSASEGLSGPMFAIIENLGTGDTLSTSPGEALLNGLVLSQLPLHGLLSGERTVCPILWRGAPGASVLLVGADSGNRIQEASEAGNSLLEGLEVSYPDLVVGNISWTPHLDNESLVTVFAEVQNTGTGTAGGAFQVSLAVDAQNLGAASLPCLPANSSALVSWRWPLRPGNHTLSVVADSRDAVREASENNNRMDATFPTWRSTYSPPLVNLRLANLSFSQANAGSGGRSVNAVTLHISIENDGQENLSATTADVIVNGRLLKELSVPATAADSMTELELTWAAPVADLNVTVRLDGRRRLQEDFETDNDLSLFIPANHPPVASVGGNRTITAGDRVDFHGLASDPDVVLEGGVRIPGYIALYEWDLNGDGLYERNSTISGDVSVVFHTPGRYVVRFRVTDDQGATAVSEAVVTVKLPEEQPLIRADVFAITGVSVCFILLVGSAVWLVRGREGILRK